MPRSWCPATGFYIPLKLMLTVRFLVFVASISFGISVIWIQLVTVQEQPTVKDSLVQEVLENVKRDARYAVHYRKNSHLPKELKYILLWTDKDFSPFYVFGHGQKAFLNNNCSMINCYVTNDRKFFSDTRKFDAILFNGRNVHAKDLPKHRSPKQKFVYVNLESSKNCPICNKRFDGYFNWTSTYRLGSDIPYPYIMVKNKNGTVIGPKKDIVWPDFPKVSKEHSKRLRNKSKAAAWFVSSCRSRSGRLDLVKKLQRMLHNISSHSVDIYGKCGPLKCPRSKQNTCNSLLKRDYFFYLALENSFDEDYVTEKLLTALNNDVVPIVYGGADYSRFLPQGSYLDARKISTFDLAIMIDRIISSPMLYRQFFRWKGHLTYSDPTSNVNVCGLCAALNDKERVRKTTVYKEFRKWWHPKFHKRCAMH